VLPQTTDRLFNDLVSASELLRWHLDAERLGSLEVDDQVERGRKLAGFAPLS
jgi:hypothetical protein